MMTAQAMQSGLEVKVPEVKNVADAPQNLPVVTVLSTGVMFLNDAPLPLRTIPEEIARRFRE
jgi:biopolymer transport protein ExbD